MSDSKMHVDPALLRGFAQELTGTLQFYGQAMEALDAKLTRLSQSWRDRQFDEFKREVATTRSIVLEFIREGKVAHMRLLEDAQNAEDYYRMNPPS